MANYASITVFTSRKFASHLGDCIDELVESEDSLHDLKTEFQRSALESGMVELTGEERKNLLEFTSRIVCDWDDFGNTVDNLDRSAFESLDLKLQEESLENNW